MHVYIRLLPTFLLVVAHWIDDLELPEEITPYHIKRNDQLRTRCLLDEHCPYQEFIKSAACWGYENGCQPSDSLDNKMAQCNGRTYRLDANINIEAHKLLFNELASFERLSKHNKYWKELCTSGSNPAGSQITCVDHLAHCHVRNFYFDFKNLLDNGGRSVRYRTDVIQKGQVGGNCMKIFDEKTLLERADRRSYLQSWADELIHWQNEATFQIDKHHCDVIFDRPTVIIKLDASINMFHHFCDFINLYASQHLNGSFDRDIDILWYDTFNGGFIDHYFGDTWKAFSKHKPVELVSLNGKKVCFRDALLPLLARQRLGLYYNMPVADGCNSSALFYSFNKFILHRLNITQYGPLKNKLRVTLLARSTEYRRVLNQDEIIDAMKADPRYEVAIVDFKPGTPFLSQLEVDLNTDIFISIHGSGLTHLLFLPDWAGVFEIYNCDDPRCYKDLAALRGVYYQTWENEKKIIPDGPGKHPHRNEPHKKFANYSFDPKEFMRLLNKLYLMVQANMELHAARIKKYGPTYKDEL